ncbi:MAG: MATE family efflux transporter [Pseudomonadota bacterium]
MSDQEKPGAAAPEAAVEPEAGATSASGEETRAAETSPAETGPAETGPAETGPAETGPAETSAKFVTGDLRRHVLTMSAAGSVGLMAIFLVDLADLFFISLLGQAELAAAVGYAASILFFTMSVGIGLAIAVGALVSRAIGAGEAERARLWATHAFAAAMGVSLVVGGAVWLAAEPLIALVGARGETARLAVGYLSIVAPSLPLTAAMMCAGAVLRAHGDAKRSMTTTIVAALVNGVLDPIFIFAFAMGLDGAAWATVASRAAGAAVGLWPIIALYGGFSVLRRAAFGADLRAIFAIAGPAMATNVATPIGAAYLTRLMSEYGDAAVAGYAIVGRLTPVAFGFVFALSGAIGPIVGQNYGAGHLGRVRETMTETLKIVGVFTLGVSVLLFALSGWIVAAFGAEGDAALLVYWFCGPLSLLFFFNGVLFATNAAFNNLGRPFLSTLLNWGRHTLGAIPPALLGAALLGPPGVLLGQALGGVAFAALALWRAYRLIDEHEAGATAVEPGPRLAWRWPLWPFSTLKD